MKKIYLYLAAVTVGLSLVCATCAKDDEDVAVASVTLNQTTATLDIGNTLTLTATVLPENAANKVVEWANDNSSVVHLAGSTITGVGYGTATITATTQDGNKTASCVVTIADNRPPTFYSCNCSSTSFPPATGLTEAEMQAYKRECESRINSLSIAKATAVATCN